MLGTIFKIEDNQVFIKLNVDISNIQNLMNLFVIIQDSNTSFIGEIVNVDLTNATINLLGEYKNNSFIYGYIKKPSFTAKVNLIASEYIEKIINPNNLSLSIGKFPFYDNVTVNADLNKLFGSHIAIFGSTGSGKSCGFARIIQNLMLKDNLNENMNLIIFDAFGEYHNAFKYLNDTGKFAFKSYTSSNNGEEKFALPLWFLDVDDIALLLEVQKKSQLAIIEKALRNITLLKKNDEQVNKYKNSVIANAILDILASGRPASQIRDQVMSALSKFNTADLNLDTIISQPGYNRTFRQCLIIDDNNKINAIELVTSFLQNFLVDDIITSLPDGTYTYTLEDLLDALDFALISEGIWKSEKVFDDANVLKVRLTSLINSENKVYFEYPAYITKKGYIERLFHTNLGKKCQIVNFNIDNLNDRFAKTIVKIYAKLFFNYAKDLEVKATMPFNIFLEEAHRYVQNDNDIEILGYNIFERIAKEGRKYGVLLGLISQRPNELSETCISQCNNFLVYRITHPVDLDYISKVIPDITYEMIERIKSVQPGYALAFGSAFKMPLLAYIDMPTPAPDSSSTKIDSIWFDNAI